MADLDTAIARMEDLKEDDSVPSNVKDVLDEGIDVLENGDEELSVRINTVTSLLDDVSNDPNIAQHTRTEVWNIASMLEQVNNGE